jgi:deoxyribose-phosphate aldolase
MQQPDHRNPGVALDLDWVHRTRVRRGAIDTRVALLEADRIGSEVERVRLLLRVVACLDLTYLDDDGTEERVRALCARARQPLSPELAETSGAAAALRVAAVCVHHRFLPVALAALEGSGIPVAVVSAGFPHGGGPLADRLAEIRDSVAAGADEIDAVVPRAHVLAGDWQSLYDEVRAYRAACGGAILKTILATGALATLDDVARASAVCLMAGADFLKTSTGREVVNATLPAGVVMARVIRGFRRRTGTHAGLKPAGGITTTEQALAWARLVERELGRRALRPASFRVGASRLLEDIAQALARHGVGTKPRSPRTRAASRGGRT